MIVEERLDKDKFFKAFSISEEYFQSTGLEWEELLKIYDDYVKLIPELEKESKNIVHRLTDNPGVHSVRRRVKKATHLIEKIIRKGTKYKERGINVDNYREIVTDLIGIRVLHLYKDEWRSVHNEIVKLWQTKETPQINIRRGDYNVEELETVIKDLNLNCEVIVRDHGYRSVHYLIGIHIKKILEIQVEIQVRTVFEEAWSEIDHQMRYPYDIDNPVITEYLGIFNRIVGSADEMGMFIKKMKKEFSNGKNIKENFRELDLKFK